MKSNAQILRTLRVCVTVVGYLIALFGAFSIFRLPLSISFLALIAGFGLIALASRSSYSPPSFTWRFGVAFVAGSALILGVLWLIGEDRVRLWTPHPAGYMVAWFICLLLFRHLRQIFHPDSTSSHAV